MNLKRIVEQSDTRAGLCFDTVIYVLIVVSLITFSIETLPNLPPTASEVLYWIEFATVLLFTGEYLLRLAVAEPRGQFVRSFFGLLDLVAILPFYLAAGVDLRAVRTFRLLRLIRILKLARYSAAIRRLHRAAIIVREELVLFINVALILIFLSAVGIYYFESSSNRNTSRLSFTASGGRS